MILCGQRSYLLESLVILPLVVYVQYLHRKIKDWHAATPYPIVVSFIPEASTTSCNKFSGVAKTAHAPGSCTWPGLMQNISKHQIQWIQWSKVRYPPPPSVPLRYHHPAGTTVFVQHNESIHRLPQIWVSNIEGITLQGKLLTTCTAQFSPTMHCDIDSESEEPDALHMAPTSASPK